MIEVEHWKKNLLISLVCFSPLLLLLPSGSGAGGDTLAWFFIIMPGFLYPFYLSFFVGITMLIIGIIGGIMAGMKTYPKIFPFILLSAIILFLIILSGPLISALKVPKL